MVRPMVYLFPTYSVINKIKPASEVSTANEKASAITEVVLPQLLLR